MINSAWHGTQYGPQWKLVLVLSSSLVHITCNLNSVLGSAIIVGIIG